MECLVCHHETYPDASISIFLTETGHCPSWIFSIGPTLSSFPTIFITPKNREILQINCYEC